MDARGLRFTHNGLRFGAWDLGFRIMTWPRMTFYCISPLKVYASSSPSFFFLRPDPAFPHRLTPGAARLGQEAQGLCADCATYAHKEVSGKNSCSPKNSLYFISAQNIKFNILPCFGLGWPIFHLFVSMCLPWKRSDADHSFHLPFKLWQELL